MVAFMLVSPPPELLLGAEDTGALDEAEPDEDATEDEPTDDEATDDDDGELVDDAAVDELDPQAARARPPTNVMAANWMDFFTSTSMLFDAENLRGARSNLRWI